MSGLAEVLHTSGFKVSGSDLKPSKICSQLSRLGIEIHFGHAASNLSPTVSMVVYSSAVHPNNPEIVEAIKRDIPVVRRAEVLAELMRLKFGVAVAGAHGKTTTTSMIAAVMEHGGLDPTVIIGGQLKRLADPSNGTDLGAGGSGARLGKGDFLVAESDESDRSFLLLKPTIAVVTNVDNEHLSAYSSIQELESAFEQFISSVPFYGLRVLCIDDPFLRGVWEGRGGRAVSYGVSPDADIRAEDFSYSGEITSFTVFNRGKELGRINLPLLGSHLALNSLAAVAVGLEFGIPAQKIIEALESFKGVSRRLEVLGSIDGSTVISDYAHHPTEIRASLAAVRNGWPEAKIAVVFQPHRYSRTVQCFAQFIDSFQQCDHLVVTEVYSAGEEQIEGVSGDKLCQAINHGSKQFLADPFAATQQIRQLAKGCDLLVCMGAGTIGRFADELVQFDSQNSAAGSHSSVNNGACAS